MTASPITNVAVEIYVKVNAADTSQIDGFQFTARVEQEDGCGAATTQGTGFVGTESIFGPAGRGGLNLLNAQGLTNLLEDLSIQQKALPNVGTSAVTPGDNNVYQFSVNAHGAVESAWETKFVPAACEIADAYGDAVADFRMDVPEAFAA